jgi:hypothetical protein
MMRPFPLKSVGAGPVGPACTGQDGGNSVILKLNTDIITD